MPTSTRPSAKLRLVTTLLALSLGLVCPLARSQPTTPDASALGELLYAETFNGGTNVNGWFVFGGGENFTHRGDVIPCSGSDGTNAFIFSANAENYRNYWFGGIGRAGIIAKPWTSLEKLTLQLDLGSLGDPKTRRVALRLVQGDPNKPTWSAKWALQVSRTIKTYTLSLDTGEQTGDFNREAPVTLHALTFGHTSFGAASDVQILVDNVKTFGRDRIPPPQ